MANGGRPKINIDWGKFETYCAMQCTLREIAGYFDCSEMTIERKVKEHYGCCFVDTFKRKRQKGLMSLRVAMFKMAEKSPQMAIFLAKNWLGMTDKQEITGADGGALVTEIIVSTEAAKKLTKAIVDGENT